MATAPNTSFSEEKYSQYERQDQWFSIMYPSSWSVEETKLPYKFTVKFHSEFGNLIVAIKEPTEGTKGTFANFKKLKLSPVQLKALGHSIYDNVPGILDAEVFATTLSNEKALGSVYFYELNTMNNSIGVMQVFKLETLHKNKFYKIEGSTNLYKTPQEANIAFNSISPTLELIMKSFVFLPY